MNQKLKTIISDYIQCACYCTQLIRDNFDLNNMNILRSLRLGNIPKEGSINGIYFYFHGIGCYFKLPNGEIDFDFGEDERVDGFDEFKLKQFYESHQYEKKISYSENNLVADLQNAVEKGEVYRSHYQSTSHLFYLTPVKSV